ncbi:MAG TPA: hypothetical protein DCP63_07860 [Bacteroidetes bacterium]|nr:hypothetical protein [Bacteroidota bacterium]
MQQFMVIMKLPEFLTEEFVSLIPHQRIRINELMARGTLTSYSLAIDRSVLWATILGNSDGEVRDILQALPLTKFVGIEIHSLAFHNVMNVSMLQFSMN